MNVDTLILNKIGKIVNKNYPIENGITDINFLKALNLYEEYSQGLLSDNF